MKPITLLFASAALALSLAATSAFAVEAGQAKKTDCIVCN